VSAFFVWLALMALLSATAASAFIPMGERNTVTNFAISCAKALLIAIFFMNLRRAGALLRLVAIVALLWAALLFGLSGTDYVTRHLERAPWGER
jgi:cytochrome c oxidase subunit 4